MKLWPPGAPSPIQSRHKICFATARTCRPPKYLA